MRGFFTIFLAISVLALAPVASAQSTLGYGPGGKVTESATSESAPAVQTQAKDEGGGLPFTGLDVGLVALAGLALVGVGVALRRLQAGGRAA
jgi:hypothetical protein